MPEVSEQPIPLETKHEAPIVGKVRKAIEKAWEGTKAVDAKYVEAKNTVVDHTVEGAKAVNAKYVEMRNDAKDSVVSQAHKAAEGANAAKNEYWEIRHAMQDRLAWHGGGVYKYYVENMDKMTETFWGSKRPELGKRIMEVSGKVRARLEGAALASTSAIADIFYNIGSFPLRVVAPFPKDIFKRYALNVARGAFEARAVLAGEPLLNKGVKAAAEGVISAPEVAVKMAKPRVEQVVDKILHPKPPMPVKA